MITKISVNQNLGNSRHEITMPNAIFFIFVIEKVCMGHITSQKKDITNFLTRTTLRFTNTKKNCKMSIDEF